MTRLRLTLEFDGGAVHGLAAAGPWADRPGSARARDRAQMTGETVTVHGAGRTDAGVHALAMAAHVDIAKTLTAHRLREGLNALRPARPDRGARRSSRSPTTGTRASPAPGAATSTASLNRRAPLTLERGRAWHIGRAARRSRRCTRARARWSGTTISPPSARPIASRTARSRRSTARRRAGRRRSPHPRRGAQLPPSPGALDGRLPGAGRARAVDARGHRRGAGGAATAPRSGLNAPPEGLYFVEATYAATAVRCMHFSAPTAG